MFLHVRNAQKCTWLKQLTKNNHTPKVSPQAPIFSHYCLTQWTPRNILSMWDLFHTKITQLLFFVSYEKENQNLNLIYFKFLRKLLTTQREFLKRKRISLDVVELRFYHIYRAVNRGWGIQPPKPPISLEMGCKFCSTQKRDQFFDNYWSFPNILTILSLNLLLPRKK